jgi:uncharacterized protein
VQRLRCQIWRELVPRSCCYSLMLAVERIPTAFLACYSVLIHTAERVIATLRAYEAELRQAGLRSLSLFGSVARGETETDSDIDLAAEFDPAARMDLLQLMRWSGASPSYLAVRWTFYPNPQRKAACRIRSIGTAFVPSRHDPAASLADILENL